MFGNKSLRSRDRVYLLACAIEFCWLAIIALVPIVFLTIPDSPLELPKTLEFPKIVLFRFLVFLMVVLCFLKYLLTAHSISLSNQIGSILSLIKSKNMLRKTGQYFRNDPFRLIILIAVLYFMAVTLSTLFSHNLRLSLWGYVPGSDNYSFYNLLNYGILFLVIASNLRSQSQLLRLLSVVIVVGALISGYGILQYYGLGFLNVGSDQWPGVRRVTSTVGNPIFLGSFLIFTMCVSMMVGIYASISCNNIKAYCINTVAWGLILGSQMTALLATGSRGPILGALVCFFVFSVFSIPVLGLVKALKSFLIPILAFIISISLVSGADLVRSDAILMDPSDSTLANRMYTDIHSDDVVASSLLQRISIIRSSLSVISDRPIIDDNATGFRVFDHIFGYGPESFQIAFMHSSGVLTDAKIPISTNHPHNFLVHEWIETGLLGFITILGVILAIISVCCYWLIRFRKSLTLIQALLLIGIVSLLLGRVAEQLVGIGKVTDLTLFWIMVGIVCNFMILTTETTKIAVSESKLAVQSRSFRETISSRPISCVMILFATIMLALLLWYKTIVPAIAFAQSSNINDDFVNGNFASVAESLQKSLITDPAQYLYYSNLAYLYETASKSQIAGSKMVNCTDEAMNVLDTDECFLQLTYQAYLSGIDSGDMRWESRYKAAQSATKLAVLVQSQPVALDAIRLYEESIFRVPNSHVIRLSFAKALIHFGNSEKAVEILMDSLDILGDSPASIDSKFWLGIANANIGNVSAAYEIWSEVIAIDPSYIEAYQNLALIDEANGQTDVALERYSHVISLLENDLASWSNEGVSTYDTDLEFLEESLVEAYIQRASLYLLEGRVSLRDVDVERLLEFGVEPDKISHLR